MAPIAYKSVGPRIWCPKKLQKMCVEQRELREDWEDHGTSIISTNAWFVINVRDLQFFQHISISPSNQQSSRNQKGFVGQEITWISTCRKTQHQRDQPAVKKSSNWISCTCQILGEWMSSDLVILPSFKNILEAQVIQMWGSTTSPKQVTHKILHPHWPVCQRFPAFFSSLCTDLGFQHSEANKPKAETEFLQWRSKANLGEHASCLWIHLYTFVNP